MNEDHLPPSDPGKPEKNFARRAQHVEPPNFWLMVVLGVAVLIICCVLCAPFQSLGPFWVGGAAAILSIFGGRGYRGLFVGFAVPLGLVLLFIVTICGNAHPSL